MTSYFLSYVVAGERREVRVSSPEVAKDMVIDINGTTEGPFFQISRYSLSIENEEAMRFPWAGEDLESFKEYVDAELGTQ
jgi:hypothetical protein